MNRTEPGPREDEASPRPVPSLGRQALNIPNLITYVRILAVPIVMAMMHREGPENAFLAAVVFGLASLTDAVDGWLARRLGQVSVIGQLLDPLADKLIVAGTLIVLVELGRLPGWVVFIILGREMLVTGLRSIAASEGMVIAARPLGKYKTAFQMIGIWCLIVHYPYPLLGGDVSFRSIGGVCLAVSVVFSLWSAADYVAGFLRFRSPS